MGAGANLETTGRRGGLDRRADHKRPGADPPPCDQSARDIRIASRELLDGVGRRGTEHEKRAVGRVTERPGEDKRAALMCLLNQPQVFLAVWHPPLAEALDGFVLESEVSRGLGTQGARCYVPGAGARCCARMSTDR